MDDDLASLIIDLRAELAEQTVQITAMRSEIEDQNAQLESFVPKNRFWWSVVGLVLAGLCVVGTVVAFHVEDRRAKREAVATDQAFCALANNTRGEINRNRAALRADGEASRKAYNAALAPQEGDDAEDVQRKAALLAELLTFLDAVSIDGDLALLDCRGIGDGRINFSRQETFLNATTTSTRP